MAKPNVLSAEELQNKTNFNHIEILVQHEEDEPLNCEMVDCNLGVILVNRVPPESLLHGKVQNGDYLLSINDKTFKDRTEMFSIASRAFPHMKLIVARAKSQASDTPAPSVSTIPVAAAAKKLGENAEKFDTKSQASDAPTLSLPTVEKGESSEKTEKSTTESESPQQCRPCASITCVETETDDPRKLAASKGFNVRPDREYLLWRAMTTNSGKSLGLGIMRYGKDNLVLVSSVQPNSVSSDIFKPGDRFLAINNTNITDVQVCKKLIVDTKGDFDALIERPPNGLQAYGLFEKTPNASSHGPLKSSYTQPIASDPEQQLGDPFEGYRVAPCDVQDIINRQIPLLRKVFGVGSQRSSQRERMIKDSDRLKIEQDVHEQDIGSDVPRGSFLRKPPKR